MPLLHSLAIIALLAWTTAAAAQAADPAGPAPAAGRDAAALSDYEQALGRIAELETALTNAVTRIRAQEGAIQTPPDVMASYYAALRWDYEYAIRMREHTDWLFWWQLISVYALLGVTILIVLFGVYVSVRELGKAMRANITATSQPMAAAAIEDGEEPLPIGSHRLKISPTETSITTTLTGVLILVLALGYLFLFVNKVMNFTLEPATVTAPARL